MVVDFEWTSKKTAVVHKPYRNQRLCGHDGVCICVDINVGEKKPSGGRIQDFYGGHSIFFSFLGWN